MKQAVGKLILFVMLVLTSVYSFADQIDEWLKRLDSPRYAAETLAKENKIAEYSKYDLSLLFVPRTPFLGYIGNDFRRLNIYFTSISRSTDEPNLYLVKGVSLVGKNKSEFSGSIRVEQAREYKTLHCGIDDEFESAGIKSEGILIGRYKLEETPGQTHDGVFEGLMTLNWVVDRNGLIHSDHLEYYSDNYRNNQYVGTWVEYGKDRKIVANWGEARIPFSSELDNGAAEFHPNEKYIEKGWKELYLP